MKTLLTTIAAGLIASTAALAQDMGRYEDLRLDTSDRGDVFAEGRQRVADPDKSTRYNDLRLRTSDGDPETDATFSTRGGTTGEGFAYGGYGPGNDSR